MISLLVWKALDLHQKLNAYLPKCPIQWNPKIQRFYYFSDKNFTWICSVIGLLLIQSIGSTVFILSRQDVNSDSGGFTFLQNICMLEAFLEAWLGVSIAIIMIIVGKQTVLIMNVMIQLEVDLHKDPKGFIIHPSIGESDIFGILVNIIVITLTLAVPFLTMFGFILDVGPVIYFARTYLPKDMTDRCMVKILIWLLNTILTSLAHAEMLRLIPFIIFCYFIPVYICHDSMNVLESMRVRYGRSYPWNYNYIHRVYRAMEIVIANRWEYSHAQDFLAVVAGIFTSTTVNYFTLTFYPVIPKPILPIFIVGVVGILLFIELILPWVIKSNENSIQKLHAWKSQIHSRDKHLRKKFRALKPFRFEAGLLGYNLFQIQKSMRATYYKIILDCTMSAVITFPMSTFSRNK